MTHQHVETNPHFIDPEELTPDQHQFLPPALLPRRGHAQRVPSRGRRDQQQPQPRQPREEPIPPLGHQDQQPQQRQSQEERPQPLGPSPPEPRHEGQWPHQPLHVWVPPAHHEAQHPQPRQGQQRQPLEMWVPPQRTNVPKPKKETNVPKPKKEKHRPRNEVVMQPQLQDQHPGASLIRPQPEGLEHHPSPVIKTPRHQDRQSQELRPHSRLFLPQDRQTKAHTWFAAAFCIIFWLIIIIGGVIVLIVYLVFRPRIPHFDVNSVTLNAAYLDMGYLLNADLTVLANFTNPNKKVSVDFSYMYLDLFFENTLIATQYIEPFSAARGQSRFANIHMVSSQVKLSMKESMLLQKQMENNRVIFTVKGMFRARSNLGSLLKYSYWLHGQCGILVSSPPTGVLRDKSLAQAWSLDFRRVVIGTECLEVIRIHKHSSHALLGNNLVDSILNWTQKEWKLVFRHVPRHRNIIADSLASLGWSSSRDGLSLLSPLADLSLLVEEEKERSVDELLTPQDGCVAANEACFNLHSDPGG
ncbi:hypothetical protein V6N11_067567 [Hibiscus sabdariffa]|uniref:RNase H type-1 domain-containing protein n=1 Tax=Hibiscus sabdariffa TaxID=183260 RepID=A0ABR2SS00_9ROSI